MQGNISKEGNYYYPPLIQSEQIYFALTNFYS